MLEELKNELKKVGLKMYLSNTKVLFNGNQKIEINNHDIGQATEQIYLGQKLYQGKRKN